MERPSKESTAKAKTGFMSDDATTAERQAQIKNAKTEDAAKAAGASVDVQAAAFSVTDAAGGFSRVPVAILDDSALSSIGKLVMIALYRYGDENGVSTPPSKGLLSSLCGITDRWLYLTLKDLEKRGYIAGIKGDGKRIKQYQLKYKS